MSTNTYDGMTHEADAILPRGKWVASLRRLAVNCAQDEPSEVAACVIEMNRLLLMAPELVLLVGLRPIGPLRLRTLLNAGGYETAVMMMLDPGAGFILSRGGEGQSLATVALPGERKERSGEGATPAMALVGALALSLAQGNAGKRSTALRDDAQVPVALH